MIGWRNRKGCTEYCKAIEVHSREIGYGWLNCSGIQRGIFRVQQGPFIDISCTNVSPDGRDKVYVHVSDPQIFGLNHRYMYEYLPYLNLHLFIECWLENGACHHSLLT